MLAQIQVINARAERASNDLYAANQQLARIDADLKTNGRHLTIARQSLGVAQTMAGSGGGFGELELPGGDSGGSAAQGFGDLDGIGGAGPAPVDFGELEIPGAAHELLRENDQRRSMVWAEIDRFLEPVG